MITLLTFLIGLSSSVTAAPIPCDASLDPRVRDEVIRRVVDAQARHQTELSDELLDLGFPKPKGEVSAEVLAVRTIDGRHYCVVGSRFSHSCARGTLNYLVVDRDGRVAEFDESDRPAALRFDVEGAVRAKRRQLGRDGVVLSSSHSPQATGWSARVFVERMDRDGVSRRIEESYDVALNEDVQLVVRSYLPDRDVTLAPRGARARAVEWMRGRWK